MGVSHDAESTFDPNSTGFTEVEVKSGLKGKKGSSKGKVQKQDDAAALRKMGSSDSYLPM